MITEEDKDEFIGQMRGLAFTEDGRYETKAKELLNELIDEIKGQLLPIDSVSKPFFCVTQRGCLEQCYDCALTELEELERRETN